jgi:hypothetical protein
VAWARRYRVLLALSVGASVLLVLLAVPRAASAPSVGRSSLEVLPQPAGAPAPPQLPIWVSRALEAAKGPNPIVVENRLVGSTGWRIGQRGYRIADDATGQIKGYDSATSVETGQPITFYVSVRPAQLFHIDLYRLGWYGGSGGRLVYRESWTRGIGQALCPMDAASGLRTCHWRPTLVLTIPAGWVSGLYVAVLTNLRGYQNVVPFVVRNNASSAPLLYVEPVATYQAYNDWPEGRSGKSLYGDNSSGAETISGRTAAVKVSFDRPYAGSGAGNLFIFDQPFAAWLERYGYDVTYATSIDLDEQGAALLIRHRVIITAGHDEYWTAAMRAAATAARDRGVSLAFFGANNMYWQARLDPSPDGRLDRVLVCYRNAVRDPEPNPMLKTVRWRDPPLNRPEEALLGSEYTSQVAGRAPFMVVNAGSWVYRGTGLTDGQSISGLVYGEADRPKGLLSRRMADHLLVLSSSPFWSRHGQPDRSEATIYRAASGALVFDAGTFGWPAAVDPIDRPDPRIQQVTANILDRMLSGL